MAKLLDKKFIHSVYFWLKKDISQQQIENFEEKLEALTNIKNVKQGFVGKTASTARPIIDRSYDYALILVFDSIEQHDLYQDHPVHEDFRQSCGEFWIKVTIYDAE